MHRPGMLGVGLLWNGGGSMSETLTTARRAMLHRRVRFIVGFTITYNVIEAIVAVWAGVLASSAALIGFGLDSVVEVLSVPSPGSSPARTLSGGKRSPSKYRHRVLRAGGIRLDRRGAGLVGQESTTAARWVSVSPR